MERFKYIRLGLQQKIIVKDLVLTLKRPSYLVVMLKGIRILISIAAHINYEI